MQFTLASLTTHPCVLFWEGLRASEPQHHLINLGFPSHIVSDSKEQSGHVSLSRKPVSLVAQSQKGYVPACLPAVGQPIVRAETCLCIVQLSSIGKRKGLQLLHCGWASEHLSTAPREEPALTCFSSDS